MPMKDNYARGEGEMDLVASHQRLLVGAAMRTTGPMLELGVGWYSTPILHEIAVTQRRLLVTADNNKHWLAQFRGGPHHGWPNAGLECEFHEFHQVGWWGEWYDLIKHGTVNSKIWGLCFVDHGQPCEREYAVRALIDSVEVFVFHDTEDGFPYGYDRTLPMFKYQWTDKCQKAWTTIASSVFDVTTWFRKLPPVEPTEEVT